MTVAAPPTIPKLLESLMASFASAQTSLPDASSIVPPNDGISLLNVKNDLFLSYLQHLVFLILLKLRKGRLHTPSSRRKDAAENNKDDADGIGEEEDEPLEQQEIVNTLIQCRVYLERGVRPLEGRLKYQMDKVLRAADDAARKETAQPNRVDANRQKPKHEKLQHDGYRDDEDEEASEDDASEDETENEDEAGRHDAATIDELSYRPNPAAFLRPSRGELSDKSTSATKAKSKSGVYRPPRITPVAPPTDMSMSEARQKAQRRPRKSAVLDEYIATELSTAPLAEPSIGTTVVAGGRRNKTARERQVEQERREYEETHFVRLPKESRKERAAAARRNMRNGYDEGIGAGGVRGGYGGEEWRGLGEGVDRIERLTSGKKKSSGQALLERSRKRELDLGRDDGTSQFKPGERFEKRRKILGKRNRTKANYK